MKPYDPSLLEIFSAEQAEHIQRIRAITNGLPAMPPEARAGALEEILRRAHTLKGAARAVGLETTEQLAHRLEALFGRTREAGSSLGEASLPAVHRGLDAMEDVLAAAIADRPEPDCSAALYGLGEGPIGPAPAAPTAKEEPETAAAPAVPAPATSEFVRVNATTVDGLIRASSQLLGSLSAQAVGQQRADDSARRIAHTLTEFERLRRPCNSYLRAHEDDVATAPLKECLEYVERELRALLGEARSSAAEQHHRGWELRQRVTDLHQNAIQVRMIPAESVFGAFGAMARQIAQDEGKEIEFRAEGLETQADRLVLQALKDPVMHLLRNAVSHGIEAPEGRAAAGKPLTGSVRLRIDGRGNRLNVIVEDDGRGLNLAAVRNRAVAIGVLAENEAMAADPQQLAGLIFRPGFSTSESVTSVSGRGFGLSVVQESVDRLQGQVDIHSRHPSGLRVTIAVGLSISTHQLLLFETGGYVFGMQTRFVEQLARVRLSEIKTMNGRDVLAVDGKTITLARLSDLLGLPPSTGPEKAEAVMDPWVSIVTLVLGEQTIGVIVDRLMDARESVIKDLGLPSRMTGMTAGGIPLEDGRVALLLNPIAIFDRFRGAVRRPALRKAAEQERKRRILVVDDSLTTRSLERSILEANGFEVSVAVDGIEALEKLSAEAFDLIITDVMMPRMDGMQLLDQIKRQKSTEHIPVIMVTSMESKQDQERGMSLGADAYIVKRKFDQQELLRTVRQIL